MRLDRFNLPEEHEEFLLEAFLDKIRRYYVLREKSGLTSISKNQWFVYNTPKQAIECYMRANMKVDIEKQPLVIGKKYEKELTKKMCLYTVEGRGIQKRTEWYVTLKDSVKVIKEEPDTFSNLCDKYDIKYELKDMSKDKKKKEDMYKDMVKIAKDYITKNHKELLGKSLKVGSDNSEVDEFYEGDTDRVAIVYWDLWAYNSRARAQTEEDEKKNEEFYKIVTNIQKELEKHTGEDFTISEDGDWDDGLITLYIKK